MEREAGIKGPDVVLHGYSRTGVPTQDHQAKDGILDFGKAVDGALKRVDDGLEHAVGMTGRLTADVGVTVSSVSMVADLKNWTDGR